MPLVNFDQCKEVFSLHVSYLRQVEANRFLHPDGLVLVSPFEFLMPGPSFDDFILIFIIVAKDE